MFAKSVALCGIIATLEAKKAHDYFAENNFICEMC